MPRAFRSEVQGRSVGRSSNGDRPLISNATVYNCIFGWIALLYSTEEYSNSYCCILLCCIAPELWCFLYIELYCTVLPAISNATPQSILNSISAHTACVSTVYHFPRHCVFLYCSVEMPVHWLVMGSIIQRLLVTIIQQDRSKANHQTFHYDDDLHGEYDYQGKKQNAVLLHFPKRGGVVSPSPKFPKKKI